MASALPPTAKPSAMKTRSVDDSVHNVKLIGRISHQIVGAKLPSKRQLLQLFFFFHMRIAKRSARASAVITVKEVLRFWEKARIPSQDPTRCADKVEKLYEVWKNLNKKSAGESEMHRKNVEAFIEGLDDLFDIAHAFALTQMKNEEDKDFLTLQRQKGRPGSMMGIDMNLPAQEQRTETRQEKEKQRKRKHHEMMQQNGVNFSF